VLTSKNKYIREFNTNGVIIQYYSVKRKGRIVIASVYQTTVTFNQAVNSKKSWCLVNYNKKTAFFIKALVSYNYIFNIYLTENTSTELDRIVVGFAFLRYSNLYGPSLRGIKIISTPSRNVYISYRNLLKNKIPIKKFLAQSKLLVKSVFGVLTYDETIRLKSGGTIIC